MKHQALEKDYLRITPHARDYLADLLKNKAQENKDQDMGVRVFITQPGTPQAETCLAYCPAGEEESDDLRSEDMPFNFFVEKKSIPYLAEAYIDFQKDDFGGQLTIKAPHSKMMQINAESPMSDKINYVLHTEINPALASHGGMVSLVSVAEDGIAILQFGGGCQGCGMIDVTLKQGVEKTLLEKVDGLRGIRDSTDHSDRTNAYY